MPATSSRSTARPAATVLLVLLVGGCAGKTATSTAASTPGTTTSTVAPTTSTVSPSRLTEEAWLTAVTKVHKTIDKPFTSSINMTRAKMVELENTLGSCSRELARIGSPSHRLQPVYVLVKKACRTYDQGAKCFATAARVSDAGGAVIAGTPEERTQKQAMDCGFAAQGDGGNLLSDAEAKGEAIQAAGG
jgi:hypothetical protein